MYLDFCAVCGIKTNLEHHHIKPRVLGGEDAETNIITLCGEHHGQFHGYHRTSNLSDLIFKGVHGHTKEEMAAQWRAEIEAVLQEVDSLPALRARLGWSESTLKTRLKLTGTYGLPSRAPKYKVQARPSRPPKVETLSNATREEYGRHWRTFELWCLGRDTNPIEATPQQIVDFLASRGISVTGLRMYAAAISRKFRDAGLPKPTLSPEFKAFSKTWK